VITTIMMNYIAFSLSQYLITGPFVDPNEAFKTPFIEESAHLFRFFEDPLRLNIGLIIAIAVAFLVWYILYKTTWGFEFRTVGLNPHAAKYSGINSSLITILALTLSGAIAGLAGAVEMLGVNFRAVQSLTTGYGFDAIAIALLAKNHPLVVIITAMMFGFMRQGQAFILFFIAAPAIIRTIYRLKEPKQDEPASLISGSGEKV